MKLKKKKSKYIPQITLFLYYFHICNDPSSGGYDGHNLSNEIISVITLAEGSPSWCRLLSTSSML